MPKFLDTPSWYDGNEGEVWAQPRLTLAVFNIQGTGDVYGCGFIPLPGSVAGGGAAIATWINRYYDGVVTIPFSGVYKMGSTGYYPTLSMTITAQPTTFSCAVEYVLSVNPGGLVTQTATVGYVLPSGYDLG